MNKWCTGVILSGGQSTRMSGNNKAFIELGGRKILDYIYNTLKEFFENIMIVTKTPLNYAKWDALIVKDIYPYQCSLSGIYTALFYATTPYAFITACDTPFLKKDIIQLILDSVKPKMNNVVPETSNGFETLCALYSKDLILNIENNLKQKKFKIQDCLKKNRTIKINENRLKKYDPNLLSFLNVNCHEDLIKAKNLAIELQ